MRGAPCRVGGGIRTIERARTVLGYGATHVIVGSSLFRDGQVDVRVCAGVVGGASAPARIIAAVDTRGGHVTIHGWRTTLPLTAVEAVHALTPFCAGFLCTLVDGEGLMQGFDLAAVRAVRSATDRQVIAAGGITTRAEIEALHALGVDAVVGMAIYTGRLPIDDLATPT